MASAGKGGGLSAPGASAVARPLSRGGAAESAPPTPGGRPRHRPAGGDPPLRSTQHRHAQSAVPSVRHSARSAEKCHRMHRAGFSPQTGATIIRGATQAPSRARLSARRSAMAQAPPLTGPGRESPGPHSACRVEGRSGRSPSAPAGWMARRWQSRPCPGSVAAQLNGSMGPSPPHEVRARRTAGAPSSAPRGRDRRC